MIKENLRVPDLSDSVTDISFISFDLPINKNKVDIVTEDIKQTNQKFKIL